MSFVVYVELYKSCYWFMQCCCLVKTLIAGAQKLRGCRALQRLWILLSKEQDKNRILLLPYILMLYQHLLLVKELNLDFDWFEEEEVKVRVSFGNMVGL